MSILHHDWFYAYQTSFICSDSCDALCLLFMAIYLMVKMEAVYIIIWKGLNIMADVFMFPQSLKCLYLVY